MLEEDAQCLREFRSLCTSLNLDKSAADKSWLNYTHIKKSITLEGDQRHWLGCAIYVACRRARVQTVGSPTVHIEGNLVSLVGLLRQCNLTVLDFFRKCKKWMEWSELPAHYRARLDHLERNFTVAMVIFLKYRPIFTDMFKEPTNSSPQHKSKKPRNHVCSAAKLFDFTWKLFLCLKSRVPDVAEDLVNSFHLLLATCDLIFANALLDDRRDLLNPSFVGLPSDYNSKDYKVPSAVPCIIDILCKRHGAISVEAAFAKTYCLRPQISAMMSAGILAAPRPEIIINSLYFERIHRALDSNYAEYIISVGDFDERIFLSEDANDDIGTSTRAPEASISRPLKRDPSLSNVQNTPLSGRELLKDKESPSKQQTPLSAVTLSVRHLISLISGRPVGRPSDALLQKFRDCSPTLEHEIAEEVSEMGRKFIAASLIGQAPGRDISAFFERRLESASTLYYRFLEGILAQETTSDLKSLLETEIIHQSVFTCALEIVMFSYNAQRPFPWVLDALGVEPFYFYRIIEIIVRSEDLLSRSIVKHLSMIEERVLESLAWRSESPLWAKISGSELPVPRCDEVSFANQLLSETEMSRDAQQQQQNHSRPQLADRFASPVSRVVRPGQSLLNANNQPISFTSQNIHRNNLQGRGNGPTRTGSLALFFRKFYFLANLRMQDLCTRLEIVDVSLKRKIWTCFEHSIVNETDLMQDRHLDQILMCAVYVMCRVLDTPEQPTITQFTDILKMYRNQPQAESSVYRNVLLRKETGENGEVTETRVNLIQFYNTVYMQIIQDHAMKYVAERTDNRRDIPLSPLPRIRQPSPSRKFSSRLVMNAMDLCPNVGSFDDIDGHIISIHDSPAKDLDAINEKIARGNMLHNKAVKRILDDSEDIIPAKKSQTLLMKISSVMKDRSKQ